MTRGRVALIIGDGYSKVNNLKMQQQRPVLLARIRVNWNVCSSFLPLTLCLRRNSCIKNIFLALLLLAWIPSLAHANVAISFLGVVTAIHLLIGNVALGIIEGYLLARFFRLSYWKSIASMIPANYLSSWAGFFICNWIVDKILWVDIYNAQFIFGCMVGFAYLLTLALEGPFVFFLLRRDPQRWVSSLKASILLQTTTYILLLIVYVWAGVRVFENNLAIVPLSEINPPHEAQLFYISEYGDSVFSQKLDGTEKQVVCELQSQKPYEDHLYVRQSESHSDEFEIVARLETDDYRNPEHLVVDRVKDATGEYQWHSQNHRNPAEEPTYFNHGATPLLGSFGSDWTFHTNFHGNEGIYGINNKASASIQFSVLTHFFSWSARNAVLLPGDFVVFQLGEDQICLIDADAMKIALVARGRGPAVVLRGK